RIVHFLSRFNSHVQIVLNRFWVFRLRPVLASFSFKLRHFRPKLKGCATSSQISRPLVVKRGLSVHRFPHFGRSQCKLVSRRFVISGGGSKFRFVGFPIAHRRRHFHAVALCH